MRENPAAGNDLMREILAHPDDDAPRIVYADWLQQHSTDAEAHAHAELIHAQCALERAHPSERPALHARAKAVLKQYKRTWLAPITNARIGGTWQFRRGFLDSGSMTAVRFVEVAEQLFQLAPMLRAMIFPEASNELIGLARSPYLARLDDVDLDQMCKCGRCKIERELPELFSSPHVANLRRLVLSGCRIDADNARRLFESTQFTSLRILDLHDNRIEGKDLEALAAHGGTFDRLSLAANPIGRSGAEVLARATALKVRELDLSHCGIDAEGARALADAPWADGITRLALDGNQLGKGVARAALRSRFGRRVRM